ncbi:MAG: hypothetical protein HY321_02640 [Armatimonadetes bacterium]|nr:hypothetical protein [Armatimonadota bacterium]
MRAIAIEWQGGCPRGTVEVTDGRLVCLAVARGVGSASGASFAFSEDGPSRLEIAVDGENVSFGPRPTMLTVRAAGAPFTVLLRDVSREFPVFLPMFGVVVTTGEDTRSYGEIAEAVRTIPGRQTALQRIECEPEESYEEAAAHCRRLHAPTWLGVSRDMRLFEVEYGHEAVRFFARHYFHGRPVTTPETGSGGYVTSFRFGRGAGCVQDISRRLEEGVLPILCGAVVDGEVTYRFTNFATMERTPLTREMLRGTHFLAADGHGNGHMFTESQAAQFEAIKESEIHRDEEVVLYIRVEAINTGAVPRYAWLAAPFNAEHLTFDGDRGFGVLPSGRVFSLAKLNGAPLPQREVAVLLKPGEVATLDAQIPHQPISAERAAALAAQRFEVRHAECRAFWQAKLDSAAQVRVPEPRVDEMIRAGLLHLDLVAYGLEPDGPVAATIGRYCPIGSESAPIIQYLDCMGWHKLAERAIGYFLEKQHDDGFIQNFGGYMLETGPALWTMGEHYRLTRNEAWVKEITPKLLKSVDFLIRWRERNQREELRGKGYGMMEGKVADPKDPFRTFMLNGYAYQGLVRAAEMLAHSRPDESRRIQREAEALKADVRAALLECLATSPAVPLGDGTWCPTVPPWAEARGPAALCTDGQAYFTHGTFLARDSLCGPLYLAAQEALEPNEPITDWLLDYHADLFYTRNVGFSQPYYSPHPRAHLLRGETKAFLKEFYNGFAGLADRETYTFWEHYWHASPHKTHEEAWFLMRTRWMLHMERGDTLHLLAAIPRAWMEHGQRIEIRDAASYFGPFSLRVESQVAQHRIHAVVECATERKPARVALRLPHPLGQRATDVTGGDYDPAAETVRIALFPGRAEVTLTFGPGGPSPTREPQSEA